MPLLRSLLLRRSRRGVQTSAQAPATSNGAPGLTVAVVAHNEADILRACLDSVSAIASEIVVVDAGSDDGTAAVAAEYADRVISIDNRLEVDGTKNLAIDAASRDWVLIIDPDERVTPALRDQIRAVLSAAPEYDGYLIPRRNYELGRWIRTMGHYPGPQLRLIRRGRGRYAPDRLHAHLVLDGPVGLLDADLLHFPRARVWDYAHKRNFYSEQRSRQLFADGVRFSRRRLLLRPIAEFGKSYLVLGGWLDGMAGFVIAAHGGWAAFLTEAKLWQLWQEQPAGSVSRGG
jgi:glycosyltransferase involved in cell wall biosynthesis